MGLCSYPHQELWHNPNPREPCPPASVSPKKLPSNLFPPNRDSAPASPASLCPRHAQRGSTVGPPPCRVPSSPRARPGSSGSHTFPAALVPPQGSYQQLPGAPAHTLIRAGLRTVGVGWPCPQPQCRGPEHPVGHTPWGECHPQPCLPRKLLQPGKTGSSHHRKSLLKSNPTLSGKWGGLRAPTSFLGQLRDAPGYSQGSESLHSTPATQEQPLG